MPPKGGDCVDLDLETYLLLEHLYDFGRMSEDELFHFTRHANPRMIEPLSRFLMTNNMIKSYNEGGTPDGSGGTIGGTRYYEITLVGKAYVENRRKRIQEKRLEKIRYAITTGIAVVALITAIVSIVLQYIRC